MRCGTCCPSRRPGRLADLQQARIDLIGADLAFLTSRGSDAPSLLLKAAKRLEPIDADLSRATYLQALCSAMFAGRLALGGGVLEVASDVEASPSPTRGPRASDFLLDGLVAHYTTGYAAGVPMLRKHWTSSTRMSKRSSCAGIGWQTSWPGTYGMTIAGSAHCRHVQLARDVGALSELPMALMRAASAFCSPASWSKQQPWFRNCRR